MMKKGKLYLIPASLGDVDFKTIFPSENIEIVKNLYVFIVEDIRTARRFLRKTGYRRDFNEVTFHILNKNTNDTNIEEYLNSCLHGIDIGLLSEAGLPCVADPGANVVRLAHYKKIKVIPLTGPSSIFMALMASGFNGQSFCFHGYLPIEKREREKSIRQIEKDAYQKDQTQIFIETPYRNMQLLDALLKCCSPETSLCIACDISLETENIYTKRIKEWKRSMPDLHKKPTVFLLYK